MWFNPKHSLPKYCPCRGLGRHPREDPFGVPFEEDHYPDRWAKAGSRLAGPYTFALDGIQGDQDFIAFLFALKRTLAETGLPILKNIWWIRQTLQNLKMV